MLRETPTLDAAGATDVAAAALLSLLHCHHCSFEYFDKDRSNSLNYDEILCALQHAGALQHSAHQRSFYSLF